MTTPASYEELRAMFRWRIPAQYNIARDTVGRWAAERPAGSTAVHGQKHRRTRAENKMAQTLRQSGYRST